MINFTSIKAKNKLERATTATTTWNKIFTPHELASLPFTILVTIVLWVIWVHCSDFAEFHSVDHYNQDDVAIAPRRRTILQDDNDKYIKPFVPWKQRKNHSTPIPCILEDTTTTDGTTFDVLDPRHNGIQSTPTDEGLLYIKPSSHNTRSSNILASVAVRTAIAIAERSTPHAAATTTTKYDEGNPPRTICRLRGISSQWSEGMDKPFSSRNHDRTFLWTFLKRPSQHALDLYLSDGNAAQEWEDVHKTTFDYLQSFVRFFYTGGGIAHQHRIGSFQTRAMSNLKRDDDIFVDLQKQQQHNNNNNNTSLLEPFVRDIVDDMDFVGTVERMDESLVLLSFLLDLEVTDVLYYNSEDNDNTSQESSYGNSYTKTTKTPDDCSMEETLPLPGAMVSFLKSNELDELLKIDNALYDIVDRKLDKTIQHTIGRAKFERRLQEFLAAKHKTNSVCNPKIKLACTTDGIAVPLPERSKCYAPDIGCGYECLDQVVSSATTQTTNGSS